MRSLVHLYISSRWQSFITRAHVFPQLSHPFMWTKLTASWIEMKGHGTPWKWDWVLAVFSFNLWLLCYFQRVPCFFGEEHLRGWRGWPKWCVLHRTPVLFLPGLAPGRNAFLITLPLIQATGRVVSPRGGRWPLYKTHREDGRMRERMRGRGRGGEEGRGMLFRRAQHADMMTVINEQWESNVCEVGLRHIAIIQRTLPQYILPLSILCLLHGDE